MNAGRVVRDEGRPSARYNFSEMPRRKKKQVNAFVAIATVVGTVCAIEMLDSLIRSAFLVVAILFAAVALLIVFRMLIPVWRRNELMQGVDTITDNHIDALVRQRTMQVRNDPYGRPILDKWHSEVSYFIAHHVRPTLNPNRTKVLDKERAEVLRRICERVADAAERRPALTVVQANTTPVEFEVVCARSLRACGWETELTPLSRDQGVDVIAHKNSVRVVLQCKLYSKPVGNKAVQEISAGRLHHQAHHGAVVSNGTYTASAKQLAATNGILLLHHTDLPQLEQILKGTTTQLRLSGL